MPTTSHDKPLMHLPSHLSCVRCRAASVCCAHTTSRRYSHSQHSTTPIYLSTRIPRLASSRIVPPPLIRLHPTICLPPSSERRSAQIVHTTYIHTHAHTYPRIRTRTSFLEYPFLFFPSPSCVPVPWISFTHSPPFPLPPLASLGLLTTGRGPPPLVPFHLIVVVESSLRYRCAVRSCTLLSSNPKQKPSTRVLREGMAVNMLNF